MRECGSCTLCCTVTRVPELNKPENVQCSNCKSGCSIYNERPTSCRTFACEWLKGDLDEIARPDKLHVLLEKLLDVPVILVLIEPGYEATLDWEALTSMLATYTNNGITVVASNGMALLSGNTTSEDVRKYVYQAANSIGVI